jgi:hypothetical protein
MVAFLIILHHAQSGRRIKNGFGQNAGEQEPDQKMMGQGNEQQMVMPAQPTAGFIMVQAEFAFARQQLDILGIGQELSQVNFGAAYRLPPSSLPVAEQTTSSV